MCYKSRTIPDILIYIFLGMISRRPAVETYILLAFFLLTLYWSVSDVIQTAARLRLFSDKIHCHPPPPLSSSFQYLVSWKAKSEQVCILGLNQNCSISTLTSVVRTEHIIEHCKEQKKSVILYMYALLISSDGLPESDSFGYHQFKIFWGTSKHSVGLLYIHYNHFLSHLIHILTMLISDYSRYVLHFLHLPDHWLMYSRLQYMYHKVDERFLNAEECL